jgi:hypothetical protein
MICAVLEGGDDMGRLRALVIPLLATLVLVGPIGLRSASAQAKTARGTVVTATDASLTVKVGAREMTFGIDRNTSVLAVGAGTKTRRAREAGAPGIKLTDAVKTGGAVVVTYREANGAMQATEVRAVSSAGAGGGSTSDAAAPGQKIAAGKVKSVADGSLTITSRGKDLNFSVDPSTKVLGKGAGTKTKAAGGRTTITNLVSTGDTVSVSYRETGATMQATSVRVTVKAP